MAELDKFKRRVIRTVARMMLQEKKPEDEMWELLKKETGCDCELLWKRMRSLTLKKMKRLLLAEDKVDNIIPVARMSLTDWLLFDLVLVHEDVDVIGEELGLKTELRPLTHLLDLVQRLGIEGKQGVALFQAWTAATLAYNKEGRQCSPMLLQLRWYQMKKMSRTAFYKFWFTYRGNYKLLANCKDLVPTKLQMEIAQRFPHIITKPFLEWEEMINKKFVVLPHEIEKNMKSKEPLTTPTPNETVVAGDSDIVLLEPNIETIDLSDAESETNDTNGDKVNTPTESQLSETVVVKTEPTEEIGETYSKSLSELLEQRGAMLLESIPNIDDDVLNSNIVIDNVISNTETDDNVEENEVTEVVDNADLAVVGEKVSIEDTGNRNNELETDIDMADRENVQDDFVDDEYEENIPVEVKSEFIRHDDESMETDNDLITEQMQINELIVMPQIANVFSNIDDTEQLPNISSVSLNEKATESAISANVEAIKSLIASNEKVIDSSVSANVEAIKSLISSNEEATEPPTSSDVEEIDFSNIDDTEQLSNINNARLSVEATESSISANVEAIKSLISANEEATDPQTSSDVEEIDFSNIDDIEQLSYTNNARLSVEATESSISANVEAIKSLISANEEAIEPQTSSDVEEIEPPLLIDEISEEDIEPNEPMEIADNGEDEINQKLKAFLENNPRAEAAENNTLHSNNVLSPQDNQANDNSSANIEIPIDLTFADDGIELVEDDDFEDDIIKPIKEDDVNKEIDPDDSNDNENENKEENAKFDLKLLMQPVVYTTKLDDMVVFKNIGIGHVDDLNVIHIALSESKPISTKSQNINEEKLEDSEIHDNTNDETNDSEGNMSEDEMSESEDLPIDKRVKLSSYLLQKPRSRTYNPIQLCKNPDFNTRLKRLTVGFLSSTRNRSFLKTLKPMTIDVSKAFENKLVKGTMYLQRDKNDPDQTEPIINLKEEVSDSEQATSVLPSAMPVQSLINALVQDVFVGTSSDSPPKQSIDNPFPQRNKVINLPDIDHVRKMNQRLFTAEITPMRIQNPNERCLPPVQLVPSHSQPPSNTRSVINNYNTSISGANINRINSQTNEFVQSNRIDGANINRINNQTNEFAKTNRFDGANINRINSQTNEFAQTNTFDGANINRINSQTNEFAQTNTFDGVIINRMNSQTNEFAQTNRFVTPTHEVNENCPVGQEFTRGNQVVTGNRPIGPRAIRGNGNMRGRGGAKRGPRGGFRGGGGAKRPYSYYTPCRSKPVTTVAWLSNNKCTEKKNDDALLTIDTLNKMLTLMQDETLTPPEQKAKKNKKTCSVEKELKDRLEEFENTLKQGSGDQTSEDQNSKTDEGDEKDRIKDSNLSENDTGTSKPAKPKRKPKVYKMVDVCCWARHKMDKPNTNRKHRCPRVCKCCCSQELVDTRLRQLNTVAESIEKNVEKSGVHGDTIPKPYITITPNTTKTRRTDVSVQCNRSSDMTFTQMNVQPQPSRVSNVSSNVIEIDDNDDIEPVSQPPVIVGDIDLTCKETLDSPVKIANRITVPPLSKVSETQNNIPTIRLNSKRTVKLTPAQYRAPPVTRKQMIFYNRNYDQIKEKLIYLNNKQKTNTETGSPIFLGRNKILLTDQKIPSSLNATSVRIRAYPVEPQQPQPPAVPQLELPEGVQIMLLPDGQLTCTVDPSANVDPEKLATLPTILAAIQQQLAVTNATDTKLQETQNTTEVINLDTDETSSAVNNILLNSVESGSGTNNAGNDSNNITSLSGTENENNVISLDNAVAVNNPNNNIIDVPRDILVINEDISPNLEKNRNKTLKSTDAGESHTEEEITADDEPNLSIENSIFDTTSKAVEQSTADNKAGKNNVCNAAVEGGDTMSTEDKEKGTSNATSAANRRTLLSDLMEMSGISAEDTTPSEKPVAELPRVLPNPPTTPPRQHLQAAFNTPEITTSPNNDVKELCSITSFAQLRYACNNNGNFFKLDLETGAITQISVCIKKNQSLITKPIGNRRILSNNLKSVIDLTDDPPSDNYEPPAFVISKPTQSLLKDTFHLPNSAKPLRLFRSASILNRKPKPITDDAPTMSQPEPVRLRKRKQTLDSTLETNDSEDSIDQYLWNNNSDNDHNSQSEYESSDDEPLAVKAKRIKTSDETAPTSNGNSQTNAGDSQETTEKILECIEETPVVINNDENTENEKNNDENDAETEIDREITFLSDHDDEDSDNCILGV